MLCGLNKPNTAPGYWLLTKNNRMIKGETEIIKVNHTLLRSIKYKNDKSFDQIDNLAASKLIESFKVARLHGLYLK